MQLKVMSSNWAGLSSQSVSGKCNFAKVGVQNWVVFIKQTVSKIQLYCKI